jgi:hypothetical protein
MKAKEVYKGFKTYTAKILVKNPQYSVHMDAIVNAKDVTQARQLIKLQYNVDDGRIGTIREIKQ